jgi:hypothetical protein
MDNTSNILAQKGYIQITPLVSELNLNSSLYDSKGIYITTPL